MDWQPIKTAPKDGSEFLAFGSYLYPEDSAPTTYMDIVEYSGDDMWPWENGCGEKASPTVYSHWMPLPEPPK